LNTEFKAGEEIHKKKRELLRLASKIRACSPDRTAIMLSNPHIVNLLY